MADKVDDLSPVNPSKDPWNVVVKVLRLWVSPSFSGSKLPFSMELIFIDAKVHILRLFFPIIICYGELLALIYHVFVFLWLSGTVCFEK